MINIDYLEKIAAETGYLSKIAAETGYLSKIAQAKWRKFIDTNTAEATYSPNKDWKSVGLDPQSEEFMTYLGKQFKEPQVKYHTFLNQVNEPSKINVLRNKRNALVQKALENNLALKGIDRLDFNSAEAKAEGITLDRKAADHPVIFAQAQPPLPENQFAMEQKLKQDATEARNVSQQIGAFKNKKTPGFTALTRAEALQARDEALRAKKIEEAALRETERATRKAAKDAARREALKKRSFLYLIKEHPKAAIGIASGLGIIGTGTYLYNQRTENNKWRNI